MTRLLPPKIGTLLALAAIAFGAAPAAAQAIAERCNPRPVVIEFLGASYEEIPIAMGLQSNGAVVEVFAAKERRTFTIVVTVPSGVSCVISAGEAWEAAPVRPSGPVS